MATNPQLSTTESKNKLSKQPEQEQIHRNKDHMEDYQWGRGVGRMGEKVKGVRRINGRHKNRRGGEE